MQTDEDCTRRLELFAETINQRVVDISAEIAEEEESKKRRLEKPDVALDAPI